MRLVLHSVLLFCWPRAAVSNGDADIDIDIDADIVSNRRLTLILLILAY